MGDSTAMTIEFLRARLLSERSVSRSARQRADQLAKRVLELEEQLRIVTIQRKKAEKAVTEVLAILESQGVNDFPEVIDSSSDRDHVTGESKGSDENTKGDETSATSRMDRSDVEDGMSGSEVEVSTPQGRILSWKSRNNVSDSHEKRKEYQARQRQRQDFISTRVGSSPQHLMGKSCRRIKSSRDMGSASENGGSTATQPEHTSDCADDEAQLCKETCDIEQEKVEENILHSSEDQNEHPVDIYADRFGRDETMEKALRQQAQLIVQYQAEENAQREWEEKFNETNCSTPASCEQLEILVGTGEDEAPVEDTKLADETFSYNKETKMSNGDTVGQDPVTRSSKGAAATDLDCSAVANIAASDMHPSCVEVGGSIDGRGTTANERGSDFQEFELPGPSSSHAETCEKQCHEVPGSNVDISVHSESNAQLCTNERLGTAPTESPAESRSSGKFSKGQWSLIQNQIQKDLPEPPNNGLGNVLDALQRAKLSLRQELGRLQQQPKSHPPPQSARTTTTDSQSLAIRSSDTLGIPFGSAGLFRLPTDITLQVDLPRSSYFDTGLSIPTLRSFSGLSDGYMLNTRTETRTAVTSSMQYPVPTRTGMPAFTRSYSYAATDLTTRPSSYDRLQNSSYMGVKTEMPGMDGHTVYSAERSRLDMLGVQRLRE